MLELIPELFVSESLEEDITKLLKQAFYDFPYPDRSYYKQRPNYRLVYKKENQLIAYMGLDLRSMTIDEEVYQVLGIIDLCVHENFRGQGIASHMLDYVTDNAKSHHVDIILLFADNKNLYEQNGFKSYPCKCQLLMLDEHKTYGVKTDFYEELMIKPINKEIKTCEVIDMMGYLY